MIEVYCDGACVPNPDGVATIGWIIEEDGIPTHSHYDVIGSGKGMTNNVAEYTSVLNVLHFIDDNDLGHNQTPISVFSDSKLLVEQINGNWATNAPHIRQLQGELAQLLVNIGPTYFYWKPREEMQMVDNLTNKALEDTGKKERMWQRWLVVKNSYDAKHQQLFDYMMQFANKFSLMVNVWYKTTTAELGFSTDTINDILADFIRDGLIKQSSANWNGVKIRLLLK